MTRLAFLLALLASPAAAQTLGCLPHEAVAEALASRYGETRQGAGIGMDGAVIEIWANLDSGTWTATRTAPGALTCILTAGQNWERTHEPLPAPMGEPA